jgi:hypothetical protein
MRGINTHQNGDTLGIIPNIDREYAASTEFIQKQSALLKSPIIFRRTSIKTLVTN